ncbi:MAG: hypothetical protein QNJ98_14765, partial [Planctomycetota bacterium]|nr:hypothetical protein [Planctomycetota bacterium]
MSAPGDLSHRAAVLTADKALWWSHFRGGVHMACLDGSNLLPVRADPSDVDEMATPELLDLLEYGALIVADLVGMHPRVFSLISWITRARPESVLLLRHGSAPLPFELQEFAVRPIEVADPAQGVASRITLAEWVVVAAKRRRFAEPAGADLTSRIGNPVVQRRRVRNGVRDELAAAAAALLTNDVQAADDAMLRALAIEPDAADLLLRTALLHRRAGRWVDAVLALERAAVSAPGFAPVWRELGIVREHAGQAGALRALRR